MPLPLKPGYNFNYDHVHRPPYFEMTAAEAYTDFYGLSYLISGEVLSYSPDGTGILQEGDMDFTLKNIYFRSSYISDKPRESILIKFTDNTAQKAEISCQRNRICQIASWRKPLAAGYCQTSPYFSDCFRRNRGMSPLQFRKEMQRQ